MWLESQVSSIDLPQHQCLASFHPRFGEVPRRLLAPPKLLPQRENPLIAMLILKEVCQVEAVSLACRSGTLLNLERVLRD